MITLHWSDSGSHPPPSEFWFRMICLVRWGVLDCARFSFSGSRDMPEFRRQRNPIQGVSALLYGYQFRPSASRCRANGRYAFRHSNDALLALNRPSCPIGTLYALGAALSQLPTRLQWTWPRLAVQFSPSNSVSRQRRYCSVSRRWQEKFSAMCLMGNPISTCGVPQKSKISLLSYHTPAPTQPPGFLEKKPTIPLLSSRSSSKRLIPFLTCMQQPPSSQHLCSLPFSSPSSLQRKSSLQNIFPD